MDAGDPGLRLQTGIKATLWLTVKLFQELNLVKERC